MKIVAAPLRFFIRLNKITRGSSCVTHGLYCILLDLNNEAYEVVRSTSYIFSSFGSQAQQSSSSSLAIGPQEPSKSRIVPSTCACTATKHAHTQTQTQIHTPTCQCQYTSNMAAASLRHYEPCVHKYFNSTRVYPTTHKDPEIHNGYYFIVGLV